MEHLNVQWFTAMAAGFHPHPVLLALAQACALAGSWVTVAAAVWLWWHRPANRWYLAGSALVCVASVLIAHRLAVHIGHPRPFVAGLSPVYLQHAARGSLPSVHACALFSIAVCWLWLAPLRKGGWVALAAAMLVGWGRVYCGLHFPLDIAAGAALGGLLAGLYSWLAPKASVLPLAFFIKNSH